MEEEEEEEEEDEGSELQKDRTTMHALVYQCLLEYRNNIITRTQLHFRTRERDDFVFKMLPDGEQLLL